MSRPVQTASVREKRCARSRCTSGVLNGRLERRAASRKQCHVSGRCRKGKECEQGKPFWSEQSTASAVVRLVEGKVSKVREALVGGWCGVPAAIWIFCVVAIFFSTITKKKKKKIYFVAKTPKTREYRETRVRRVPGSFVCLVPWRSLIFASPAVVEGFWQSLRAQPRSDRRYQSSSKEAAPHHAFFFFSL